MNAKTYTQSLLRSETHLIPKRDDVPRFCAIFPNTYRVGMSNLGFHFVYAALNSHPGFSCDRAFYEPQLHWRSLEHNLPLKEFDCLLFSIPFELDYLNAAKMLVEAGIPLRAEDRDGRYPIVVAGGAAVTANPLAIAPFMDACVLGGGNRALDLIAGILARSFDRRSKARLKAALLEALSCSEGVYVHGRFTGKSVGRARYEGWAESAIVTTRSEFAQTRLIEISRGCARRCRFCLVSHIYPYENRPTEEVLKLIRTLGSEYKFGLVGSAISDYPGISEIAQALMDTGTKFSVSSIRPDPLPTKVIEGLVRSGQRTLTLAPEVATESLGQRIKKWILPRSLMDCIDVALSFGIAGIRLYFMVGLPGETDEDAAAIPALAQEISARLQSAKTGRNLTLTVNPFVPKPFTPFECAEIASADLLHKRMSLIVEGLKNTRNIRVNCESPKSAQFQAILARADSHVSTLLETMATKELSLKAAMKQLDLNLEVLVNPSFAGDRLPPWRTI